MLVPQYALSMADKLNSYTFDLKSNAFVKKKEGEDHKLKFYSLVLLNRICLVYYLLHLL